MSFHDWNWGEICEDDFYHAFRTYDQRMRSWIHGLKEGESAFDNEDPAKRPHRIVNGKIVENIRKNRDKYTRQPWIVHSVRPYQKRSTCGTKYNSS